jgi:hypothetical protein
MREKLMIEQDLGRMSAATDAASVGEYEVRVQPMCSLLGLFEYVTAVCCPLDEQVTPSLSKFCQQTDRL